MAAFRSVRSRFQIDKFYAIGNELLNGPVCLSTSSWDLALDALETGLKDASILPPLASLPASCAAEALRHYHGLYARCAQLIPMHPRRWQQWHDGMHFFLSSTVSDGDVDGAFLALGRKLLDQQRDLFAVVFWGCWSSVRVRLEALMAKLATESENLNQVETHSRLDDDDDDADDAQGENENGSGQGSQNSNASDCEGEADQGAGSLDRSIVRLRRRYCAELYAFERLARDSAHLFGQHAAVGRAERQWLTDSLLQREEEPTEALIRHSFKRDVGVPSAALDSGELLEEYAAFEVNESKAKAVRKLAQETLRGDWHAKARALYNLERSPPEVLSQRLDDLCALSCGLSQCLRRRADLSDCAMADFSRALLEASPFPAALPSARLLEGLRLLARWFERRLARGPRGSGAFAGPQAADLWPFALQRYTELLKAAVAHALRGGNSDSNSNSHSNSHSDCVAAVQAARAVGLSVARSLRAYLTASSHSRSGEARGKDAQRFVWAWVEETFVRVFLHGVVLFSAHVSDGVRVALDAAVAEAQVRVACDSPSASTDARRALMPAVEAGIRVASDESVVSSIVRALRALRRTVAPERDEAELLALHEHYRLLRRNAPPSMAECVGEEWMDFLSAEGRRVLGHPCVSPLDACIAQDREGDLDKAVARKRERDS